MRYFLEPFGGGSDILSKIYLDSATTDENRAAQPPASIVLGRNEFTGLGNEKCPHFQYVSRRHVQISCRSGKVYIHPLASQEGVVFLNGEPCSNIETELRENEFFSMLGIKQYYNYILKTEKGEVQPPSPPHIVDLLNTSDATTRHGYDIPQPANNGSSSSSDGSNKRDTPTTNNRTTLSQGQSSQPHAAVRTQSLGKANNASTSNLNNSVEILELDNSATDIIVLAPTVPALPPAPEPGSAPVVPAIDPVEAEKKIMKAVVGKLLRQYECSICYETLACAASLHPCGCCFCYACIADWATENKKSGSAAGDASVECPLCMASFLLSNALSNRMVDSAIREVLENLPEDLAAWEERLKTGTERRRIMEASNSGKSSSSNLAALASAPATATASRGAQPAAVPSPHPGRAVNNLAALGGGSRREVVEIMDSQPEPPNAWAFMRSVQRQSAQPAQSARPTGIQAFFGTPSSNANVQGAGVPPAVPNFHDMDMMFRLPGGRKRGRGLRHAMEDDEDEYAFRQAIASMQSAQGTAPANGSGAASSSSSGAARRASGGAGDSVFDLTTPTSPPQGRRSTARAVAAPTVPYPRHEEYYCVMPVTELSRRRTTCSRCNRFLTRVVVGTYPVYRTNPTEPLKPGTKAQWLDRCATWHCSLCVADINAQRRASGSPGVDWRTSNQPRNLWPIAYADLEMREQLDLSDARAWQTLLNG